MKPAGLQRPLPGTAVWHWPAPPVWALRAQRVGNTSASLMALAWGVSLLHDVWVGRAGPATLWVLCGVGAVLALVVHRLWYADDAVDALPLVWRPRVLDAALDDPTATLMDPTPWCGVLQEPAWARIDLDLGAWLLIRARVDRAGRARAHWVHADDLAGPWRWRFVHGGRLAGRLDDDTWRARCWAMVRRAVASWYGPYRADRPATMDHLSDFLPTQRLGDHPSGHKGRNG